MLSDSSLINAGQSTTVLLVIGPLYMNQRPTAVTIWIDQTDDLAGDICSVRISSSDLRPRASADALADRPLATSDLKSLSAPNTVRFTVQADRRSARFVSVLVTADNTAGASAFRFGVSVDFESTRTNDLPSSPMSAARPGGRPPAA